MARVSLIVARAANGVIGAHNTLPWRLPEDLKYFRARTMGHPIIMGRKTWDSLGRPLPGRRNMVVSRNPHFTAQGAETFTSLDAALAVCTDEEAFVIGGALLYAQALPLVTRIYLTEIHQDFGGDAHFPALDARVWLETSREDHVSESGLAYSFVIFDRQP